MIKGRKILHRSPRSVNALHNSAVLHGIVSFIHSFDNNSYIIDFFIHKFSLQYKKRHKFNHAGHYQ